MKKYIFKSIVIISLIVLLLEENFVFARAAEVQQNSIQEMAADESSKIVSIEETESTQGLPSAEENVSQQAQLPAESEQTTEGVSEQTLQNEESDALKDTEALTENYGMQDTEQAISTEKSDNKDVGETKEEVFTEDVKEPAADAAVDALQGSVITVTVDTSATDFTKELQTKLNLARDDKSHSYYIIVPPGTYAISKTLNIYSNTTLYMKDVTIEGCSSGNMLTVGTKKRNTLIDQSYSKVTGYDGYENITVSYGTWIGQSSNINCMMRFFHARNITLDHVVLTGGGGVHQMEVCAIDGLYVRNCTFKDLLYKNTADRMEALQIDIPVASSVVSNVYEDGTPMKNVYIENCTFSNVPRGVGTHTSLLGAYHQNIYIRNNTFVNVKQEAIVGLDYYNCEISGNTIKDCGGGIIFSNIKPSSDAIYTTTENETYSGYAGVSNFKHDLKVRITNNIITTKYYSECDEIQGIKIYGRNYTVSEKDAKNKTIPAGDYYISGVTISGNTITTAGYGIHLKDAKNCTIANNIINGSGYSLADSVASAKLYDGIWLEQGSTKGEITGNAVNSVQKVGILLYDTCSAGNISCNTIQNTGSSAIMICSYSTVTDIASNVIKKPKGPAINLYIHATVKGSISSNTITDVKDSQSGIQVSTFSTVKGNIKKNKIAKSSNKYSTNRGIYIYYSSLVKGSITGNTIKNTKGNAISVSTNGKAGSITGNTLTSIAKTGILVYNTGKVSGNISGNVISKPKGRGIYLTKDSTVTGKIKTNTITGASSSAIELSSVKNNLTVSGNTIKSGLKNGIYIHTGTTKYKVAVTGNKVSVKSKCYAVRATSGRVSIHGNTVTKKSLKIQISSKVKGSVGKNTYK